MSFVYTRVLVYTNLNIGFINKSDVRHNVYMSVYKWMFLGNYVTRFYIFACVYSYVIIILIIIITTTTVIIVIINITVIQ